MDPAKACLLFMHIPKTAGISVMRLLWRKTVLEHPMSWRNPRLALAFPGEGDHAARLDRIRRLPPARQARIRMMQGHFGFGAADCFAVPTVSFTVVREPRERMMSLFQALKQQGDIDGALTLTRFLEDKLDLGKFAIDNAHVRYLAGRGGNPIFDEPVTDAMADQAIENMERHMAVVGLTSRLDESLVLLARLRRWSSVAYSSHNQTDPKFKEPRSVPAGDEAAMDRLTRFDQRVYDYAVQRFERCVEAGGESLRRQVELHQQQCASRAGLLHKVDAAVARGARTLLRRNTAPAGSKNNRRST